MKFTMSVLLLSFFSNYLMAIQFDYTLSNNMSQKLRANIDDAIILIEDIVSRDEYWERMKQVDKFTCVDDNTPTIDDIRHMQIEFHIQGYWHWNIFSSTVKAKTEGNIISFNKRAGARTVPAIANTLFHEMTHVAGIGHCGLNDISKYPHIKEAIPYVMGEILQEMIEELE